MASEKVSKIYLKEGFPYRKEELVNLFIDSSSEGNTTNKLLDPLRIRGMIRNATEETVESESNRDSLLSVDEDYKDKIVFSFVGIFYHFNKIVFVLPKYWQDSDINKLNSGVQDDSLMAQVSNVYKTIKKYKKLDSHSFSSLALNKNESESIISLWLFFLDDYFSNGIYSNDKQLERNGFDGELLWEKTINKYDPVIIDKSPFYIDIISRRQIRNDDSLISRMHEVIVTECSMLLNRYGLLSLFEYSEAELTDLKLSDYGDKEFLIHQITLETNIQFNSRKRLLLDCMNKYLQNEPISDNGLLFLYGTNSMHMVWQMVCSDVIGNDISLLPDIPSSVWEWDGKNGEFEKTLQPDILHIEDDFLSILDAKYYVPHFDKKCNLIGAPGVGDIDKQYLYAFAYPKYKGMIKNAFLFPSFNKSKVIEKIGTFSMPLFSMKYVGIDCDPIILIKIDADNLFSYYLNDKKIPFSLISNCC